MAILSNWFNTHRMRAIALAFSCGVLLAINSTAFAGASISIEWGKGDEPVKQKSVKKHSKTGPPSHAPAHGYRAKHQYRYYPSHSVYYDTARGLYFFLESASCSLGMLTSAEKHVVSFIGNSVCTEKDIPSS